MFALFGRRMHDSARRATELDGLIDDLDLAKGFMRHRRGHAEMLDLRVGKNLIHAIDRTAGHACLVQHRDQLAARAFSRDLRDDLVKGAAILGTGRVVGKQRIFQEMRQIELFAEHIIPAFR